MKPLNYAEAVDKAMPFITRARDQVFPEMPADMVSAIHDQEDPHDQGAHFIEFGCYVLTPIQGERPSIRGPIPVLKWNLMVVVETPGSFNPFDGGYPPGSDDVDLGDYDNVCDCLAEMGRIRVKSHLDAILDGLEYEELERASE